MLLIAAVSLIYETRTCLNLQVVHDHRSIFSFYSGKR